MSTVPPPPESALAHPVKGLFPAARYACYEEVPLARKRIDLIFLELELQQTISVELKISDWKRALWQAVVNFQVSNESYIAIWHEYVHRATKQRSLLSSYGVGLIAVDSRQAAIVIPSNEPPRQIPRSRKRQWYHHLLQAH